MTKGIVNSNTTKLNNCMHISRQDTHTQKKTLQCHKDSVHVIVQ